MRAGAAVEVWRERLTGLILIGQGFEVRLPAPALMAHGFMLSFGAHSNARHPTFGL
jgi:hypothetical protein